MMYHSTFLRWHDPDQVQGKTKNFPKGHSQQQATFACCTPGNLAPKEAGTIAKELLKENSCS